MRPTFHFHRIIGVGVLLLPQTVLAAGIGLKFASEEVPPTGSALAPGDVAGVVPQANWNNLTGIVGNTVGSLKRENGAPSTATVSWTAEATWGSTRPGETNNNFPAGPDRNLVTGYLDSGNSAEEATTIAVHNIDAAVRTPAYDLYVYMANGSTTARGGGFTLLSGANTHVKYGSTGIGPAMHVEDPGTDINNTLHGSYLRFRNLTAPSFTLRADATLTTPNGFRAAVAAIQIVSVPEPATASMLLAATACGALFRRRRVL
jgi:hypothetical protein